MRRSRSVSFVVRGDASVPSCRFRAYQYRRPLERLGIDVDYLVIEKSRSPRQQLAFHRRLLAVGRRCEAVVYQKQLEPWRMRLAGLGGARVFFDFDDAIYLEHSERRFSRALGAAHAVLAGNDVLAEQARRHHPDVSIMPTPVEVPDEVVAVPTEGPLRLLWVGTSPNLPAVEPVFAAIARLREEGAAVELDVVTERPDRVPAGDGITARQWSPAAEDAALRACAIGLMPLSDDAWSRGKCACKALQYLAYGRSVMTAPVGVNRDIFAGREFGVLVERDGEWTAALRQVVRDRTRFTTAGLAGRAFVREHYSVDVWAPRLADRLFG